MLSAIRFGDIECIKLMLRAGASPLQCDIMGRNAQHYADNSQSSLIQNTIREAMRQSGV